MRPLLIALALVLLASGPARAAVAPPSSDVNGDGLADVALLDDIDSIDAAGATVLFGVSDRSAPALREEPGPRGFRIVAGGSDTMGGAEVIGDVNGDGLADVLAVIGDYSLYVVFGKRDTATVVLSEYRSPDDSFKSPTPGFRDGTAGVALNAAPTFASGAGDVNGDGLADLIHITQGRRTFAKVRFGAREKPLSRGFTIRAGGRVKRIVNPQLAATGDTDGDGLGDVAVVVPDPNGRRDGFDLEEMVFVVWGKKGTRPVALTQKRRSSSARVLAGGRAAGRALVPRRCWCQPFDVGRAGDLDGDGRDELAVSWEDGRRSRTDVLYGSRKTRAAFLPGRAGATITGTDWAIPFAAWGDRNGDGRDDLMLPARKGNGLRLLSGRRAQGTRAAAALGAPRVRGSFSLARPTGDMDGDGQDDLLVGWWNDGFTASHYAIVYGANPQPPVDATKPGPGVTALPPREG